MRERSFFAHDTTTGLSRDVITALSVASDGAVWLVPDDGRLYHGVNGVFQMVEVQAERAAFKVTCVLADGSGAAWVGTERQGLYRVDGRPLRKIPQPLELESAAIRTLMRDARGRIWIGTAGSGLFRIEGESFVHFNQDRGLFANSVRATVEDGAGDVWIGYAEGSLDRISTSDRIEVIRDGSRQSFLPIRTLLATDDGAIWVGSTGGARPVQVMPLVGLHELARTSLERDFSIGGRRTGQHLDGIWSRNFSGGAQTAG